MPQNSIAGLLSDSNLVEKLKDVLEGNLSSETSPDTYIEKGNKMYREYIDVILALKPFIPEKNKHKAEMLLKIFECASALQSIHTKT